STVSATVAYRKARIRLLTMYDGSMYGPTATRINAIAPTMASVRRFARTCGARVSAATASATAESLRPHAHHHVRQHDDGHAAEERVATGADENMCGAENEAGYREAHQRHARHHDEHERVDEPGHAHVRIDAGQRRDQRAGETRQSRAERKGDEAHQ